MNKEVERNSHTLQEEGNDGCVKIANDVVAMIAGIASTEVEGVSSMAGNITNELMSKVGMNSLAKGVKVEMVDNVVAVELTLIMVYGYKIPEVCSKVQTKVKDAIINMTGFSVKSVNIRIAGVNMKK